MFSKILITKLVVGEYMSRKYKEHIFHETHYSVGPHRQRVNST